MPIIRKLPEDIVRGIAAGEVVERPAAVLKELVENALDAGASRIEVEWADAGRTRLRVTDDGCGMSPEEARLSLERHATSKISTLKDLERVATFGFRGEALPSISAVSRFRLLTRPKDGQGWQLKLDGGKMLEDGPAGAAPGTTIIVEDLFFSVPARLKFLKSDATERGMLLRNLEDMVLAAPQVAFRVVAEGRELWNLPAAQDDDGLRDRLRLIWGNDRAQGMKSVKAEGAYISVNGWVSDFAAAQPTTKHQRFFVNRRPITGKRLVHALYDAYRGRLPVGRHPAGVIFLQVDPTTVDVNVHPTKREVRFSQEEELNGFLRRALATALSESSAPAAFGFASRPSSPAVTYQAPSMERPTVQETRAAVDFLRPFAPSPAPDPNVLSREAFRAARFEPVAQLYATYLLARLDGQFFLFDQHAAAERALYEKLMSKEGPARQTLLLPWVWEPPAELQAAAAEQREGLEKLGFGLEPFGAGACRVAAVPAALNESTDIRAFLEGLLEDLRLGRIARGPEALAARAACRGSVMAGDTLNNAQMDHIIRALQATESPWTCPHGRPTFLRLSDEELAKRFRRV